MSLKKLIIITSMALLAFAGNSILGRMALSAYAIDPASFTGIRLVSGALMLFLLIKFRSRSEIQEKTSWSGAVLLFLYAAAFSFAYITLDTGTGALILFGAVQLTMTAGALYGGEKLSPVVCIALLTAFAGFVNLILPGVSAPSVAGFLLMLSSGIAWGLYTLQGRGTSDPVLETAHNFMRTSPLVFLLMVIFSGQLSFNSYGIILAVISGSITSALGYVLWYQAVKHLSTIQAGAIQLLVPVLAAGAGIILLSEQLTVRFIISSLLILGGIAVVISRRNK